MNLDLETSVLQLAVKLSIVLTGAWLAHAALSRHNPRWQVWLWRVAAVGIAGLLIAAVLPPLYGLPVLPADIDPTQAPADLATAPEETEEPNAAEKPQRSRPDLSIRETIDRLAAKQNKWQIETLPPCCSACHPRAGELR